MSIDWLIGRPVKDIVKSPNGAGWILTFEDDAKIVYNDPLVDELPDVKGKALQNVGFSDTHTTLFFGTKEEPNSLAIALVPTNYGYSKADEEVSYPQREEVVETPLPDDPSTERVVDGPEFGLTDE